MLPEIGLEGFRRTAHEVGGIWQAGVMVQIEGLEKCEIEFHPFLHCEKHGVTSHLF